jgi:3-hydroxybutyryl-CoA dehydrogenase
MKILAKGEKIIVDELKQKLSGADCEIVTVQDEDIKGHNLAGYDAIFDLEFDSNSGALQSYAGLSGKPVFVSAIKKQLAAMVSEYKGAISCTLFGINALPSFINRTLAEVSLLNVEDEILIAKVMKRIAWDYKIVNDRVGMVTPRIIFMIINEACYTLQEGTAGMQDIDTSMKLGTNYPFGPFEWADRIGVKDVYETLMALYEDTKDDRYKICPLLKTLYLKKGTFYN